MCDSIDIFVVIVNWV